MIWQEIAKWKINMKTEKLIKLIKFKIIKTFFFKVSIWKKDNQVCKIKRSVVK